jgi:DNA/RNA endonuclease G (NUC1)
MKYDSTYSTTGVIFGKITNFSVPVYFYKVMFYYDSKKWVSECYLMENKKYPPNESIETYKVSLDNLLKKTKNILHY